MAKMDKAEIAKQLFSMALGMGLGRGVGGISLSQVVSSGGISDPAKAFMAKQYPDAFSPGWAHTYDVEYVPGAANLNAAGKANMGVIESAGRMQTIDEHNKAINQFVKTLPKGAPANRIRQALHDGMEAERKLPQFWNESSSEGNNRAKFKVSSSAVTGIRLTPDARIEVQWRNSPKWYTFKQYDNTYKASLAAQDLLKADSIGRAVYPVISRGPGAPVTTKNGAVLGEWNAQNYARAYA